MNLYEKFMEEAAEPVAMGKILIDGAPRVFDAFMEFAGEAIKALRHPENERDWRFAFAYFVYPITVFVIMGVVSLVLLCIPIPFFNLLAVAAWCEWWLIQAFLHFPSFWEPWIEQGSQGPSAGRALMVPGQRALTEQEIQTQIQARGLVELARARGWSTDDLWNMYELTQHKFTTEKKQQMYRVTAAASAILWKVGE